MICIESCHAMADGTLFRGRHPKNEASQLRVGTPTNYFPILNVWELA